MPKTKLRGHRMDTSAKSIRQGHPSMTPMKVVGSKAKSKKAYA